MRGPRWAGPDCPQAATHGRLLDWPGETTAWFCPNVSHVGRAFYNTDLGRPVEGQTRRPVPPLGTSSAPRPAARRADPVARFWLKVDKSGECWIWRGAMRKGYGAFKIGRAEGLVAAHRFAYEAVKGPIPEGLQLDHLCRVTACVNPDHLEPVTNRENGLRGTSLAAQNFAKEECLRGHEFTPENTYRDHLNHRRCRACLAAHARNRYRTTTGAARATAPAVARTPSGRAAV